MAKILVKSRKAKPKSIRRKWGFFREIGVLAQLMSTRVLSYQRCQTSYSGFRSSWMQNRSGVGFFCCLFAVITMLHWYGLQLYCTNTKSLFKNVYWCIKFGGWLQYNLLHEVKEKLTLWILFVPIEKQKPVFQICVHMSCFFLLKHCICLILWQKKTICCCWTITF